MYIKPEADLVERKASDSMKTTTTPNTHKKRKKYLD